MSDSSALDDLTEWQGFSKPERAAALPTLPLYEADDSDAGRNGPAGRIRVDGLIGEGGIGAVHEAVQVAIRRRVAVKIPKAAGGERARTALLSEAWAAGLLDHPNVVRVHALGLDHSGRPMVVMQHIEGSPWHALIADPNHPMWTVHLAEAVTEKAKSGADGKVSRAARRPDNIRVLMQVASAVQHAHNNAILHRDLKSANIMLGELGKIAIIDWGTAVSLVEAPESRLQYVGDITGVTGTPAYMAPEMADGDGRSVSRQTDVYLLGGILYEILTGRPVHDVDDPREALRQSSRGHIPKFPEDAPPALVRMCRKALDPDPSKRQRTAAEFRAELMQYMRQRKAREYLAEAQEATRQLQGLVESASEEPDSAEVHHVHQAYMEAELGYQQALTANVDRAAIDEGIEACRLLMARFSVHVGDLDQATQLLGRMQAPPERLLARLTSKRAADTALERALLVAEKAEEDVRHGRRGQFVTGLVWGLVVALLQVGLGLVELLGSLTLGHQDYATVWVGATAVLLMVVVTRADRLRGHNRQLLLGLAIAVGGLSASWFIADAMSLSVEAVLAVQCLGLALVTAVLGAVLDPVMWWGALVGLLFYGLAAAFPDGARFWLAGALYATATAAVTAWLPPDAARERGSA